MCAWLLGTKYFDFDSCSTVRVIKSCEYFDNEWVPDIWKKKPVCLVSDDKLNLFTSWIISYVDT